jgi:hypothetical protein
MIKKILASFILGGAFFISQPLLSDHVVSNSIAEAGTVRVECGSALWEVFIDDTSVFMVGNNHAHVVIRRNNLETANGPLPAQVVDVMWGAGYVCNDLTTGRPVSPSNIGLAVSNYMSARY